MNNKITLPLGILTTVLLMVFSCSKTGKAPAPAVNYSFSEEFDTVSNAVARGWEIKNNTKPLGTIGWTQGFFYISMYHGLVPKNLGTAAFNFAAAGGFGDQNPSYSGSDFIMTTSECGSGIANCSNWLISPETTIKNGDSISFYTRTYANPAIGADRMELRINDVDNSSDVGTDTNSIGNFSRKLLDINPNYLLQGPGSYPGDWTKFNVVINGLSAAKKTRIGFRYYVPNGGPLGPNGLGVGIDKFNFISK